MSVEMEFNGRGDRIRTYDPLVPNQMRYQTALLPDGSALFLSQNNAFGNSKILKDCVLGYMR